jgi:hypothetical protein
MIKGKRVRFFYKTMEEAETNAALIRVKCQNEGQVGFDLPVSDRLDAIECLARNEQSERIQYAEEVLEIFGAEYACSDFIKERILSGGNFDVVEDTFIYLDFINVECESSQRKVDHVAAFGCRLIWFGRTF